MLDFWYDLPPILRAVMSLLLIGAAVLIFFASGGTRIAIGLGAVGLVLLMFSSAGHDKGGYNF